MKLASPCFWWATKAYLLRKSSPYTQQFSKVIQKVIEAGLEPIWWYKYYENYVKNATSIEDDTENEEKNLVDNSYKIRLILICGFGYLVAFFVFVGELIIHKVHSGRVHNS